MLELINVMFPIMFIIVVGIIIFSLVRGIITWNKNSYYVTFLVESGDRIELCVSGTEYGMLVEGDTGRLTFQGTRYLSFERI